MEMSGVEVKCEGKLRCNIIDPEALVDAPYDNYFQATSSYAIPRIGFLATSRP
jgi:hypothetical protein